MQSCCCQPRQTLADRINAIIAKYQDLCVCSRQRHSACNRCIPKIDSNPCLRPASSSSCSPVTLSVTIPCSCRPSSLPTPTPGPGLRRYLSRRDLCPSLKGRLSLYKCPSATSPPRRLRTCSTSSSQSTHRVRPPCQTSRLKYCQPPICPAARCAPQIDRCPSRPTTCCPVLCASKPRCRFAPFCAPCPASSSPPSTNRPCSYSTNASRNSRESSSPQRHVPRRTSCSPKCPPPSAIMPSCSPCACCGSPQCPTSRGRLTALDDPPYFSPTLEREFNRRFARVDPCACATDSTSSLDTTFTSYCY